MIAGSTATGKLIQPHFQFQTHAQPVNTQNVNINLVTFLPNMIWKFGAKEEQERTTTFGFNAKGEIDNEQFREYFKTNVSPMYPDVHNEADTRMMVKVDSGPGKLEIDF